MIEASKPVVIVVSGSMGSGKTTLIRKLVEMLGGVPTLIFDEYEQFAVWLADICVVRMVQRALGMDAPEFDKTIEGEDRNGLLKRLKATALRLRQYLWIRSSLGITEVIKAKADIILDGMKRLWRSWTGSTRKSRRVAGVNLCYDWSLDANT